MPAGFDYTIQANSGVDRFRHYISLPGRQTKAGRFTIPTSATTKVVTGVGFQPDALIIFGSLMPTGMAQNFDVRGILHVGASDGGNEWGGSIFFNNLTGGLLRTGSWRDDKILSAMFQSAEIIQAEVASFDADGFTLNVTIPMGASGDFYYFAMQGGGNYHCGTALCPTGNGTQAITGLGFQPDAIFFATAQLTGIGTTVTFLEGGNAYGRMCLGGADADSQHIAWTGSETNDTFNDNVALSDVCISMMHDADGGGPSQATPQSEAELVSLDADGFTLNWTTTDGTARYYSWIAFEGNAEQGRWVYNNLLNKPVLTNAKPEGLLFFMNDRGDEGMDHNSETFGGTLAIGVCDMDLNQFLASAADADNPPFAQAQAVHEMFDGVAFGAYEARTDGLLGTMPNNSRDQGIIIELLSARRKPQIIRYR